MRLGDYDTLNFTFRKGVLNNRRPSNLQQVHDNNIQEIDQRKPSVEYSKRLEPSPISKSSANNFGSINIVGEILIVKPTDPQNILSSDKIDIATGVSPTGLHQELQPSRWAATEEEKIESPFKN